MNTEDHSFLQLFITEDVYVLPADKKQYRQDMETAEATASPQAKPVSIEKDKVSSQEAEPQKAGPQEAEPQEAEPQEAEPQKESNVSKPEVREIESTPETPTIPSVPDIKQEIPAYTPPVY
ncbi:MAG: hypothetical protein WBA74_24885, partial [Cyclobacteriaceae bacterium]